MEETKECKDRTSIPITISYTGHNDKLDKQLCDLMKQMHYSMIAHGYNINTEVRDLKFDVSRGPWKKESGENNGKS
jgi:hypothetical protein